MAALKNSEREPTHNHAKSDIYATGMTFLAAACLKDANHCYDYKNYCVNEDKLEEMFAEARSRYSHSFVDKLQNMLESDEELRPTYSIICATRASIHIKNSPMKQSGEMEHFFEEGMGNEG